MNKLEWAAKHFDTEVDKVISVVFITPLGRDDFVMFTANVKGVRGTASGTISREEYDQIEGVS